MGGLAASYAMLLATRLGVGIGEAVCAPAAAESGAVTEAARAIGLHQAMCVIPALSVALAATLWAGHALLPPPSRNV